MILKFENTLIEEIIKCIFKEANKQSANIELGYRVCSLRCLSDLVQFSSAHFKDAYFEQYWSTFFVVYFEDNLKEISLKESQRFKQQLESLNPKSIQDSENIVEESVSQQEADVVMKEPAPEDNAEEENAALASLKRVCLETIGKCWPYSTELQGL